MFMLLLCNYYTSTFMVVVCFGLFGLRGLLRLITLSVEPFSFDKYLLICTSMHVFLSAETDWIEQLKKQLTYLSTKLRF